MYRVKSTPWRGIRGSKTGLYGQDGQENLKCSSKPPFIHLLKPSVSHLFLCLRCTELSAREGDIIQGERKKTPNCHFLVHSPSDGLVLARFLLLLSSRRLQVFLFPERPHERPVFFLSLQKPNYLSIRFSLSLFLFFSLLLRPCFSFLPPLYTVASVVRVYMSARPTNSRSS